MALKKRENSLWPWVILKSVKQIQANIGNMITQQIDHGFYCILFVLQFCVTITTTFWFRQKLQS